MSSGSELWIGNKGSFLQAQVRSCFKVSVSYRCLDTGTTKQPTTMKKKRGILSPGNRASEGRGW